MADIASIIRYIYDRYPDQDELTLLRLKAMLYLSDWRHAIRHGSQITELQWEISNDEPRLDRHHFEQIIHYLIRSRTNYFNFFSKPKLNRTERDVLDFVISNSRKKTGEELERLVHSTYPVVKKNKFNDINLVTLAEEYEQVKPLLQ